MFSTTLLADTISSTGAAAGCAPPAHHPHPAPLYMPAGTTRLPPGCALSAQATSVYASALVRPARVPTSSPCSHHHVDPQSAPLQPPPVPLRRAPLFN
eukprot:3309500-Prymnesium_polylepis.1